MGYAETKALYEYSRLLYRVLRPINKGGLAAKPL